MIPLWWALCAAHGQEPAPDPTAQDIESAKQLYRSGATLYQEGDYDEAIRAFELAYELSGNPKLLFNIANALERSGDLPAAHEALGEYRRTATGEEALAIDRRLRSLEERIDAARAVVVSEPLAAAPPPAPALPVPTPPEPEPDPRANGRWALVGLSAGLGTAFGTSAALSYAAGRGFESDRRPADYARARTVNHVSVGLTSAALSAAVIGLVLPKRPLTPNP